MIEKKAAEERRKAKKSQKKVEQAASEAEARRRKEELKLKAQMVRSETFRQAKCGNSAFVREAVYKRGVAAEGLEILGSSQPSPKSKVNMETLLHLAVRSGDATLVEFLVGNGKLNFCFFS
jgi:hypothetical protein